MTGDAEGYLAEGDRRLVEGDHRAAVACYTRCADAWMAERVLEKARACVANDPLAALRVLARAERVIGPSREARLLMARAYWRLGQREIARNFLAARTQVEQVTASAVPALVPVRS